MVDSISNTGGSIQPTPEEQKLKKLVGKMYEKQSVILQPKDNSKLKAAVELFFNKPEEGFFKLGSSNYTQIRLKGHGDPLYVKVDDLGKALGLSSGELKLVKKEGQKAIAELAEEVAEGLDDSKEGLKAMQDTEKKLTKLSSNYIKALETLHNKKLLSEKRMHAILHDSDFDDVVMQKTIIDIGDKLSKYGKLATGYVKSQGKKLTGKQTYAYNVNKQGEIDIHGKVLGKGAFTKAKVGTKLQTGEKEAVLTIKEDQDEFNTIQKNLKILKDKGIRNIPTVHKYTYEVKSKGGQSKYVLGQELYCGSGLDLMKLPIKHTLSALRDAAEGYADLHAEFLVHGDIKPDNISLKGDKENNDQTLHGIINDFGVLSDWGVFKGGTKDFLSPEVAVAYEKRNKETENFLKVMQMKDKPLLKKLAKENLENAQLELSKAVTDKHDGFSFGVTIFECVTNRNLMKNGKLFSSATQDSDIAKEIEDAITEINDKIDNQSTKEQHDDALIRMNLLKVAQKLLVIDPNKRMDTKEAALLLANQCDNMGLERQKVA